MKKVLKFGIIFLFIELSIIPSTAMGKTWFYAHVDCDADGLSSDAVTWDYASPQYSFMKWFVINLDFNSAKGNGTIVVKPIGRPAVNYDFPEDFTSFRILFMYNYLGGIFFKPGVDGDYDFFCRGHGLFVEVN
jgi:hypothetical protein